MSLPHTPIGWAIQITKVLQEFQKITGVNMYPVRLKDIIQDLSKQYFPESPITRITGESFSAGFEGMLQRIPGTTGEWGIVYNTAIQSPGRINFTLAHEFGHYLLHRKHLEEGTIRCSRQDMLRWDSAHGQREAEANEFASFLLMPRNLFDAATKGEKLSLHLLKSVAEKFDVSLTAAILKWLQFTTKRAMLVVGKDGFVDWARSSEPLLKSGVYLQPRKDLIELPALSLAARKDPLFDSMTGISHKSGVWPFPEDVHEMTLNADFYDMSITLLIFPDDAPYRWAQNDAEPALMDTYDKFLSR